MKISIVTPDSSGGGIWRFNAESAQALSPHADVLPIPADPFALPVAPAETCTGEASMLARSSDETENRAWRVVNHLPQVIRMLSIAFTAWTAAKQKSPDIVEVSDWPLGFVPAILDQSVPYVVQCHGSMGQIAEHDPQCRSELESAFLQLIEPPLLQHAHCMQTLSRSNMAFWERMTGRPVSMIRPPFALSPNDEITEVARTGAVFGRLQHWKGPHILCAALRRLGSSAPIINWYGDVKPWPSDGSPANRRIEADFPDIWGSRLRHQNSVPRDRVKQLQSRALFNLVPSTWDVFNFTCVEAMAAGRPVIVSSGAGASELIVDGVNGFVFDNGDPDSLARAIEHVLALPEKRRREIGQAGRETVRTDLDPERIAQERLAAYQAAMRSFQTKPPPKPNSWLTDLLTPHPGTEIDHGALLELVPLRAIAPHLRDRLLRKLGWRPR